MQSSTIFRWVFVSCMLLTSQQTLAGDWPAFRGPDGNGISSETGLPTEWGSEKNIKWRAPLPAPGNSSPIVSGDNVFLTCAEEKGARRHLFCFNRADGSIRWTKTVEHEADEPTHKTNPYCASTPVTDGQRVVVWHGSAGLHCYDVDGKPLWSRDLGEFRHMWGDGTSPVIYKDRVILHAGPGKRVFMTAINLDDGRTLWETEEPFSGDGDRNENGKYMGSWSTPVIVSVDGKQQIVCTMMTRVNGYDPQTGEILWSCDGIRGERGDLAYSSPLIHNGFCVATGGFSGPSVGFKLGGRGNITDDRRVWRLDKNPQSIGSGVFLDEYIYKPNAGPGTIECLEAATGEVLWKDRAAGAMHWGSIVAADGRLYVTNQNGTTVVFKPNPNEFEMIAENELGEPSNSTPAFSNGQIFIRTFKHLYCIEEK